MKRLLCLALAACGHDGATTDAAVDNNEQRVDARVDDLDNDGILNDQDNCPTVINVGQGNEDADTLGDACDPCPVVAEATQTDTDMDGVGDACDPAPGFFGDLIRHFEGFYTAVPAGWEEIGTWTAMQGTAQTASANAGLAILATDHTRETISVALTFDVAGATSRGGPLDNKLVGGAPAIQCAIVGGGSPALALYSTTDVGGAATTPFELVVGTKYVVKLRRDMTNYTCTATGGAGGPVTVTKTITGSQSPYLSGFATANATVRVHWFMVVESL